MQNENNKLKICYVQVSRIRWRLIISRSFLIRRCTFGDELRLGDEIEEAREEEVARYFNKEYCEASLTYLVTPSDYDKLTAAYFLPEEYPREDPWPPPFPSSTTFLTAFNYRFNQLNVSDDTLSRDYQLTDFNFNSRISGVSPTSCDIVSAIKAF